MHLPVIDELPLHSLNGARVLVRVANGDDLAECLPTLEYLVGAGSRLIMAGDFGDDAADRLGCEFRRLLGREPRTLSPLSGINALQRTLAAESDYAILLPNLRRSPGEMDNDPDFARLLASLADVYCDDAFPLAHLALASTVGIVRFMGSPVAGFGMARITARIESITDAKRRPSLAIVGGTGLEHRAALLYRLCDLVDHVFIGGALCFPFLRAKGIETGRAPIDDDLVPIASDILHWAEGRTRVILPEDFVCVHRSYETPETIDADQLGDTEFPMDVGGRTIRQIVELLTRSCVLFWNGPLGAWEIESFAGGTREVARALGRTTQDLRGLIWGDSLVRALDELDCLSERLRGMTAPSVPAARMVSGLTMPALEALRRHVEPHPRRIIVPVDKSEVTSEFLERAGPLLEGTNSEIHLLFARRTSGNGHNAEELGLEADRVFDRSAALLAQFRIGAVSRAIKEGDPEDCVLEYAREVRADLVAIPERDLPRPVRRIAGDWSRVIEKRATVPLLVVQVPDE
jgi:phosphoglycerate kinase